MNSRPLLVVSLRDPERQNERDGNPVLLRNTILQSETTLRIAGWNKGNLLRSITRLSNQTFAIYVLAVRDCCGDLRVHLGSRQVLNLSEVLKADQMRNSNLSVFVLYCDAGSFDTVKRFIADYRSLNTLFIICNDDRHYFFFAFACELTHWWNIKSLLFDNVSFNHIAECIETVATAYSCGSDCQAVVICKPRIAVSIAWRGGVNYIGTINIEKFRRGAPEEQLKDILKQISQAADYPREQHSSSSDRMISSQGLFWLAEASRSGKMVMWLRETRLFRECHPYATDIPPAVQFHPLEQPDECFLSSFQNHFVAIPDGIYRFGSADESIESEPPAAPENLWVPGFSIMRYPVTYKFLKHFFRCDTPLEMDDIPVVNVSFFDAEYIAQICSAAFHRYSPQSSSSHVVRLPTEYQWEAAARGFSGYNYPWGDIFNERFLNSGMRIGHPTKPGMFSPAGDSIFGCQDMAGNVKEWTRSYAGTRGVDWSVHSQSRVQGDDRKIGDTSRMIVRGGSYSYPPECVMSWVRNSQIASRRDVQTGFRLVLEEMPC